MTNPLAVWGLPHAEVTFLRHNENVTCRVDAGGDSYALRIHRPQPGFSLAMFGGLSPTDLMRTEMDLLIHLADTAPFEVQQPMPTQSGERVVVLNDGSPACLLRWVDGEELTPDEAPTHAAALGAKLSSRSTEAHQRWLASLPSAHPLFSVTPGPAEDWERAH
ncbi:aminoglycoside phosphotransferase/kinase family protein [Aestuariimicrobium ganziense]|uniref:hypothetical protein n=1 Tax=Aestuariimicrobium ganziense TaxID=2773677 RepID=UPI001941B186|nr:hypothetical protein [Aestuariimicrobium ganziense]